MLNVIRFSIWALRKLGNQLLNFEPWVHYLLVNPTMSWATIWKIKTVTIPTTQGGLNGINMYKIFRTTLDKHSMLLIIFIKASLFLPVVPSPLANPNINRKEYL